MRTDEEILARIEQVTARDWLGTQRVHLIRWLPLDKARPLLKDDADVGDWTALPRDERSVKDEMHEYMEFAWGKANNRRGISAGRSLEHMSAWLWLLGHDEAAEAVLDYDHYGKPWLRSVCEAFGWDWRQWDDGRWTNQELVDDLRPPEHVEPLPLGAGAASTAGEETRGG